MSTFPSDYLFKYRMLDERALSIIRDRCLYFAAPEQFNDPFDCSLELLVRGSDQEMFALFDDCLKQKNARLKREWRYYLRYLDDQAESKELRGHPAVLINADKNGHSAFDAVVSEIHELIERASAEKSTEKYRLALDKFFTRLRDLGRTEFGICCFAGAADNILMWSHYAANHRGIVLCFDASSRIFLKSPGISHHQVEYSTERTVNVVKEGWPAAFIRLFSRKSTDWAYEKESRYISHTGPGPRPFKEQALRGVILGPRFAENMAYNSSRRLSLTLFELIVAENRARPKGHKLHVYQAALSDGEFGLGVTRLDDVRHLWRLYSN